MGRRRAGGLLLGHTNYLDWLDGGHRAGRGRFRID